MASKNLKLSLTLTALDRISRPLRKINNQIEAMRAPVKRLGTELSRTLQVTGINQMARGVAGVGREVVSLTGKMAALAGVGGYLFKSQLVDTAAEFEKFESILTTLEGSSEKAKKSMSWVSEFAATTPFSYGEVTDAFVRLRSYGIDPTNGSLTTLGDTSAAMGKPLMQAVEAISDAMTGENERLKEFGITTSVKGNKIAYSYQEAGKTITKYADKRNKALIESTLLAIWNSKYGGAMAEMSKKWIGMMSNLEDQWTRVKLAVMQGGLFDWMENKLANLLALIDRMAADGSLQQWANGVGQKLQRGFEMGWEAGKKLYALINRLADNVGGFGNLAKISLGAITAIMAGPLLAAVVQLIALFATNPILAGVLAIAAGLVYVVNNWNDVVGGFKAGIDAIAGWFEDKFLAAINTVKASVRALGDGFRGIVSGLNPFAKSSPLFAAPLPSAPSYAPGFATRVNSHDAPKAPDGKLVVEFQGAPVSVKSLQANSGQIDVKNPRAGVHFP